jgi:hypothetical protein
MFLSPQPQLVQELLNFPSGLIDIANALAYATRLRQGRPVYEDFGASHIAPDLEAISSRVFLSLHSTASQTVGVLIEFNDGVIRILRDWMKERSPIEALEIIIPEAQLEAGVYPKMLVSRDHAAQYTNVGLIQAMNKLRLKYQLGAGVAQARSSLVKSMTQLRRGVPAFQVSTQARWVINALASGYCYEFQSGGNLAAEPKTNIYRLVGEAIEAFASWVSNGVEDNDDVSEAQFAQTGDGRRYMSAMASRPRR